MCCVVMVRLVSDSQRQLPLATPSSSTTTAVEVFDVHEETTTAILWEELDKEKSEENEELKTAVQINEPMESGW